MSLIQDSSGVLYRQSAIQTVSPPKSPSLNPISTSPPPPPPSQPSNNNRNNETPLPPPSPPRHSQHHHPPPFHHHLHNRLHPSVPSPQATPLFPINKHQLTTPRTHRMDLPPRLHPNHHPLHHPLRTPPHLCATPLPRHRHPTRRHAHDRRRNHAVPRSAERDEDEQVNDGVDCD